VPDTDVLDLVEADLPKMKKRGMREFARAEIVADVGPLHSYLKSFAIHVRNPESLRQVLKTRSGRGIRLEPPVIYDDFLKSIYYFGAYSYFGAACRSHFLDHVGRFCSIGRDVRLGPTMHTMTSISMNQFFGAREGTIVRTPEAIAFRMENAAMFDRLSDAGSRYRKSLGPTRVGNDVWIGDNASIMAGVTLGHGCVVGTGAVVTKDTEPYGIYVGVPARLVRYRFPEEVARRLAATEWWDYEMSLLYDIDLSDVPANIGRIEDALAGQVKLVRETIVIKPMKDSIRVWKEIPA